jgi:prepilin-type processing-associated H-X9-DG protein
MLCPQCNRENPEGAAYCGFCGAQLGPPPYRPPGYAPPRAGSDKTIIVLILLVVGLGFLFVAGILAAIMLPAFAKARTKAQQASCLSNVKQLALANLMYAQDWDQTLPAADGWCDACIPYVKSDSVYRCPVIPNERSGYALNADIGGASMGQFSAPQEIVLLFDANGGWNASGGEDLMDPRHSRGANVGFVDGHAQWMGPDACSQAKWKP